MSLKKAIIVFSAALILVTGFIFFQYTYNQTNVEPLRKYKIGIIINNDVQMPNVDGFKSKMKELGYIDGANTEYIIKNAQNKPDLQIKYPEEIIAAKSDMIVVLSPAVAVNISKQNPSVPVLFMDIDPETLIKDKAYPEKNITGVSAGFLDFAGKRVEVLKEIYPSIKKIIIPSDKNHPNYPKFIESVRAAASRLQIEIVEIQTKDIGDFLSRLPEIVNKKNGDALIFYPGPNNISAAGGAANAPKRKLIVDQLIKEKMPAINHNMEIGCASEGVLACYGNYRVDVGKEGAILADKILKGVPIKDIPVVPPVKTLVLEINLKTAKSIGITIPQAILSRANKVYQE